MNPASPKSETLSAGFRMIRSRSGVMSTTCGGEHKSELVRARLTTRSGRGCSPRRRRWRATRRRTRPSTMMEHLRRALMTLGVERESPKRWMSHIRRRGGREALEFAGLELGGDLGMVAAQAGLAVGI